MPVCDDCKQEIRIGEWPWCPHGVGAFLKGPEPGTHPSEKVIVYQSAKEGGHIQYPGRADTPVPERLARRGYERKELNVRDLGAFEKKHHVMNERRHFDRNGRYD